MACVRDPWPPEEVEAMRRDLLENGKSLRQVAAEKGVSMQRISQLVGPLNRPKESVKVKQRKVAKMAKGGMNDEAIAVEMRLSVNYVANLRSKAGVRKPRTTKWNREKILLMARIWAWYYGYTPAATDWNPSMARRQNHPERAERFYEFGAPHVNAILPYFPSWSAMIRDSGLPPAPIGSAARGYWKKGRS